MRKLKLDELNRLSVLDYKKIEKIPLIVVLDNIRSMNNIGSVFRTGDAFKIEAVYLCGITAVPPHKDIHKTALGATDSVRWKYFEDTMDAICELKKEKYSLIAVEQTDKSTMLSEVPVDKEKKYAIILGHEVKGVRQEVINKCDLCLEIPQYGTKHSLNISVCAGIVIWEFFKRINNDK